jgi:acyl-CoA thioester hydrolase
LSGAAGGFTWPVRVYYEDTDAGGVVYHVNYLKFMERARTERLRSLGFELTRLRDDEGLVFAVRAASLDYLKPARLNDSLLVTAEVAEVKRVSLTFRQAIVSALRASDVLCTATVRVVALSTDGFRPVAMPDHLLERIRDVT